MGIKLERGSGVSKFLKKHWGKLLAAHIGATAAIGTTAALVHRHQKQQRMQANEELEELKRVHGVKPITGVSNPSYDPKAANPAHGFVNVTYSNLKRADDDDDDDGGGDTMSGHGLGVSRVRSGRQLLLPANERI